MLKWVGRILYVVFLFVMTIQVFSFAYYDKLQKFYDDHAKDYIDESSTYLNAMNTLMYFDFYQEDPILLYEVNEGDYQLHVGIYYVSVTQNDQRTDGFMIFVNNLRIVHEGEVLTNPVIKMTVDLSHQTLQVGDEIKSTGSVQYDPTQSFAFYNVPLLFLFDMPGYMQIPEYNDKNEITGYKDDFSTLKGFQIHYSNGDIQDGKYVYQQLPIFTASNGINDEAFLGIEGQNRISGFKLEPESYQLRFAFTNEYPTDAEMVQFGLINEIGDLDAYNYVIWRTMSIYVIVVLGFTYLIFFHKIVREKRALKRQQQMKKDNTDVEVIFKDDDIK